MRDRIFISHANPEDNTFSQWLALRLAAEGFAVWCDLTDLLGGERFWSEIERTIRERAIKVVFVLSASSNEKEGPRRELDVAMTVAKLEHLNDFVIPVRCDGIPFSSQNILLHGLNTIDFSRGWHVGLSKLLQKLEKDAVSRSPDYSPAAVSKWWNETFSPMRGVRHEPQSYVSNWYRVLDLPDRLFFHSLDQGARATAASWQFPAQPYRDGIVTFADRSALPENVQSEWIDSSRSVSVRDVLNGARTRGIEPSDAKRLLVWLITDCWNRTLQTRGMMQHSLSGQAVCHWFRQGHLPDDKISFAHEGRESWRAVVGYKTIRKRDGSQTLRNWHFAIQGRPRFFPHAHFYVRPHLLFSSDGLNVWESPRRLHRARRSQARGWWNDRWRDLQLAVMDWLGEGRGTIELSTGGPQLIRISARAILFEAPVAIDDSMLTPDDESRSDEVEEGEDD